MVTIRAGTAFRSPAAERERNCHAHFSHDRWATIHTQREPPITNDLESRSTNMFSNEAIQSERYRDLDGFITAGRKRFGLSTCDYLYWAAELGEAMFRPAAPRRIGDDALAARYTVKLDEARLTEFDHRVHCPDGRRVSSGDCPNCALHDPARAIDFLEARHIVGRSAEGLVTNASALGRLGTSGLVKSAEVIGKPDEASDGV